MELLTAASDSSLGGLHELLWRCGLRVFFLHRLQCLESCEALSGKARKVIAVIAHKLVVGKESPLCDQVAIIDALTEPAKITKAVCWRVQILLRVSCSIDAGNFTRDGPI